MNTLQVLHLDHHNIYTSPCLETVAEIVCSDQTDLQVQHVSWISNTEEGFVLGRQGCLLPTTSTFTNAYLCSSQRILRSIILRILAADLVVSDFDVLESYGGGLESLKFRVHHRGFGLPLHSDPLFPRISTLHLTYFLLRHPYMEIIHNLFCFMRYHRSCCLFSHFVCGPCLKFFLVTKNWFSFSLPTPIVASSL